jgi:hypothetical protein
MSSSENSPSLNIPCPICAGTMELVYDRPSQKVCVCVDCHSGLTIPATAWQVQKSKRGHKPSSQP